MLSEKMFCHVLCISPPGVYVGTLNLIASIPGPSILTLKTDDKTTTSKQYNGYSDELEFSDHQTPKNIISYLQRHAETQIIHNSPVMAGPQISSEKCPLRHSWFDTY